MSEADISKNQETPLSEHQASEHGAVDSADVMIPAGLDDSDSTVLPQRFAGPKGKGASGVEGSAEIGDRVVSYHFGERKVQAPRNDAPTQASSAQAEPTAATNPVTLIQQLQQDNCHLLSRVTLLETVLEECQTALQSQLVRLETQDLLIGKQAEELQQSQEKSTEIFQELESSQQTARRQQILVETLTQQLEEGQSRVIQLEQDNANVQQQCREQSRQLSRTESDCRELRSRLYRQQRQTLQFKAALEKCLEVAVPANDTSNGSSEQAAASSADAVQPSPIQAVTISDLTLFTPKAKPIQPWSVDLAEWETSTPSPADVPAIPEVSAMSVAPSTFQPLPPISAVSSWATSSSAETGPNLPDLATQELQALDEPTIAAKTLSATNANQSAGEEASSQEKGTGTILSFALGADSNAQTSATPASGAQALDSTAQEANEETASSASADPQFAPPLNETLQLVAERLLADLLDDNREGSLDFSDSPASGFPDAISSEFSEAALSDSALSMTESTSAQDRVEAVQVESVMELESITQLEEDEDLPASRTWSERPLPVNDFADCLRDGDLASLHGAASDGVSNGKEPFGENPVLDDSANFLKHSAELDGTDNIAASGVTINEQSLADAPSAWQPSPVSPDAEADLAPDWREIPSSILESIQEEDYPIATDIAAAEQTIEVKAMDEDLPIDPPDRDLNDLAAANKQSPSPLVYPLRSSKKRKSLASVDLPSFLR